MRPIKAALLRDPDKVRRALGLDRFKVLFCCAVFLCAALIKFISPGATAALRSFIFGELNQSDDYRAAFSSVGETITSGDKLAEAFGRIYVAVFGEEESPAPVEAGGSAPQPSVPASALAAPGQAAESGLRQQAQGLREAGLLTSEPQSDPTPVPDPEASAPDSSVTSDRPAVPTEQTDAVEAFSPSTLEYDYPELDPPEDVRLDYIPLPLDYTLPVEGELSSTFGYRLHPLNNEVLFHNGLDIAADEGSDVLCFADGYVRAAGEHPNLGKYYIITHDNGVETLYGHLSEWLVMEGSTVTKGQIIGKVGQSGAATGPHLHLEIFVDSIRVNPLYYFSL